MLLGNNIDFCASDSRLMNEALICIEKPVK